MERKDIEALIAWIESEEKRTPDFIGLAMKVFPKCHGQALLAYNGSLDAAKKLHEAVLPDWVWDLNPKSCKMQHTNFYPVYGQRTNAPSRNWLLAILRALASTPTKD